MATIWDDEELKQQVSGGSFFKFNEVGDTWAGTVLVIKKKRFQNGLALEVTPVEDDVLPLTAGQVMLMRSLFALQPGKGEHLSVEYAEAEKRGGDKEMKRFIVTHTAADGTVRRIDHTNGGSAEEIETVSTNGKAAEPPAKKAKAAKKDKKPGDAPF